MVHSSSIHLFQQNFTVCRCLIVNLKFILMSALAGRYMSGNFLKTMICCQRDVVDTGIIPEVMMLRNGDPIAIWDGMKCCFI